MLIVYDGWNDYARYMYFDFKGYDGERYGLSFSGNL